MPLFGCLSCGATAPPIPRLKLHVDADRDGVIDNNHRNLNVWRWGQGRRGAIVLCNNDDDAGTRPLPALTGTKADTLEDPRTGLDNRNATIDPNDMLDVARFEIRRHLQGQLFPAGWSARLSVSHPARIRIFRNPIVGAAEVIGPTTGHTLAIANVNLAAGVWPFGMEAVTYPQPGFDGLIDLTLEVLNAAGGVHSRHVARVRVAPWMATHALNATRRVFMLGDPTNDAAPLRNDHQNLRNAVGAVVNNAIGTPPVLADGDRYNSDRWMRDVMKVGFATLPRGGAPAADHTPALLRTPVNRRNGTSPDRKLLDRFPWREVAGPDFGYVAPRYPFIAGSTRDSFGNLECSPPVRAHGTHFRFGRLVYGASGNAVGDMDRRLVRFLESQEVQRPFSIDTSWLNVGHVDEVLCFCPMPTADNGFKVLLASPRAALDVLRDAQQNGHGNVEILGAPQHNAALWPLKLGAYTRLTVDGVLNDAAFVTVQNNVQASIDNNVIPTLRAELGLRARDFIHLPVLFLALFGGPEHVAYTPDVVNMLVVTRPNGIADLVIPKPFGPVINGNCAFETDITQKLAADYDVNVVAGKGRIHFADDFFTYHDLRGEIHCGTNEERIPPVNTFWWELNL